MVRLVDNLSNKMVRLSEIPIGDFFADGTEVFIKTSANMGFGISTHREKRYSNNYEFISPVNAEIRITRVAENEEGF